MRMPIKYTLSGSLAVPCECLEKIMNSHQRHLAVFVRGSSRHKEELLTKPGE